VKAIVSVARELFGLFVDDWRTSAGVIAWFAIVVVGLPFVARSAEARSALLFAGLAAVLVVSVLLGARERSSH
jgi:uncharacterized membrane protein